jgi:DNA-binding CsgD family transcriptional regulator
MDLRMPRIDGLTERERDVLVEIGRGHANAEIARHLHMSEATVKTDITHLFERLSATNRVQRPSPRSPPGSPSSRRRAGLAAARVHTVTRSGPARPRTRFASGLRR